MIALAAALTGGCTAMRDPVMIRDKNLTTAQSLENEEKHELVVLDPGFETWFLTNWSPAKDRSLSYYDSWNDQYVQAWNYKASNPGYAKFFQNMISYDPTENYGMEVSRKLYYYFRWVEMELNIPILGSTRSRGII